MPRLSGYVLDRKESWNGPAVIRSKDGDQIIAKRDSDGRDVYFSVRDDGGSIVDFIHMSISFKIASG
jgi:hypothetical protein